MGVKKNPNQMKFSNGWVKLSFHKCSVESLSIHGYDASLNYFGALHRGSRRVEIGDGEVKYACDVRFFPYPVAKARSNLNSYANGLAKKMNDKDILAVQALLMDKCQTKGCIGCGYVDSNSGVYRVLNYKFKEEEQNGEQES